MNIEKTIKGGVETDETIEAGLTYLYEWGSSLAFFTVRQGNFSEIGLKMEAAKKRMKDKRVRNGRRRKPDRNRGGIWGDGRRKLESHERFDNKVRRYPSAWPLHIISQMAYLNIYPPQALYNFSTNPHEVNGIDVAIRMEYLKEG